MKKVERTACTSNHTTGTNLHSLYEKIVHTAGQKLIRTLIAKSRVYLSLAYSNIILVNKTSLPVWIMEKQDILLAILRFHRVSF